MIQESAAADLAAIDIHGKGRLSRAQNPSSTIASISTKELLTGVTPPYSFLVLVLVLVEVAHRNPRKAKRRKEKRQHTRTHVPTTGQNWLLYL